MLLSEDDAKKVAKMMENQISGLNRERKQAARQEAADQELAQVQIMFTPFFVDLNLAKFFEVV